MKDQYDTKLFTRTNIRDGSIVIGLIVGIMAFGSWYMPISIEQIAHPILDKLDNAKSCQDVYHADVQQFMIPMMISLDPIMSKKLDDKIQEKSHLYCADLYNIEKKYGSISDSSIMDCVDLKIIVKSLPSDLIKTSVMNDYISRCLTNG